MDERSEGGKSAIEETMMEKRRREIEESEGCKSVVLF